MERMERSLFAVLCLSECFVFSTCLLRQYHIINKNLSWAEAQTYCRKTYTDLATVENEEEGKVLFENLTSSGYNNNFWIGLYTNIYWRWSDGYSGLEADYRGWARDEPSFRLKEYCVVFSKPNGWDDNPCYAWFPFVCSSGENINLKSLAVASTIYTVQTTGINVGPEFVFVNQTMDWYNADIYCRKYYLNLATIKNSVENNLVQDLVPNGIKAWIGLLRDPNLFWSDGSVFIYDKVDGPNPIGSLKDMCGFTSLDLSGRWMFLSCDYKFPFICFGPDRTVPVKKQVVKLRLKTGDSVDLNDAAGKEDLLKQFQDRLKNRVPGVTLKWREHPDGQVFHKEKKREKTEL